MKKDYYQITMEGSGMKWILDEKELQYYLIDELKNANDGTKYIVERVIMTEKAFEKLPEFEGF